jgi:Lon protease-like protein
MFELPLFPLNTVLFPGAPLDLQIFEPRYKALLHACRKQDDTFGVVLIRKGAEANGPLPEPYLIGTTAQITHLEPMPQDRFALRAVGRERFQIQTLDYDQPYLVAQVETFPLVQENPRQLSAAGERLRPWVLRYIEQLAKTSGIEVDAGRLPDDPIVLAHVASVLVQVPVQEKQSLLAAEGAGAMLKALSRIYRREVALLKDLTPPSFDGKSKSGFSPN